MAEEDNFFKGETLDSLRRDTRIRFWGNKRESKENI